MSIAPLDPKSEAELNRIRSKPVNELTSADKAFLRARRDYLGRQAREKYKDVLSETPGEQQEEQPVVHHPDQVNNHPGVEDDGEDEA